MDDFNLWILSEELCSFPKRVKEETFSAAADSVDLQISLLFHLGELRIKVRSQQRDMVFFFQ
jgi:hypothetical protein